MAKPISAGKREMILNGNLVKAILTLAIPVMLNSFIQSMYNLTDTFWLGKIGTTSQAAITLVSPFQNILINFGAGITTAGAILISQYLGAREDKQANSMANHICITSLGFSVICACICWLCSSGLVRWLGAEGDIYNYGLTYIRIVVMDLPFLFMINLFSSVRQAQGDTVRPLLLNILGVTINLILDPLFLVVFNWGIGGAAFATLIAKIPSAIIGFVILTGKNQLVRISFKGFRFDKNKVMSILKIGLPTGIQNMVISFSNVLVQASVNSFGSDAVAGFGAYLKVDGFNILPVLSISMAVTTFVGQNYGANKPERVKKGMWTALGMGVVYTVITGILLLVFADPILRLFTNDDAVAACGETAMKYFCPFYFLLAIMNVLAGAVRGTGKSIPPMLILLFAMCIFRIFWIWLVVPLFPTIDGVYLLYPVSWVIGVVLMALYTWKGKWMPKIE